MEEVKKFIEAFTTEEAEILTLKNKIDVEPFNNALPGYNVYFVEGLKWVWELKCLQEVKLN